MSKKPRNSHSSGLYAVEPVFAGLLNFDQNLKDLDYEKVEVKKGEMLDFHRLKKEGFYFILSGLLKLEIVHPSPRILRVCQAGDLVGYGNWLAPLSRNYQLSVLQDSVLQFWTKEGFDDLAKRFPQVNELIIDYLVKTILHKDERIAALESSSVDSRVAHLVLWMAKNFGKKFEDGTLIDIDLDRESMAQLAGTVPATLSRMLTLFEEEKLIRRRRRQIVLMSSAGLSKKL